MSKIVKNNTASPLNIADTGVTVVASGQYVIPPQDYPLWAASDDIVTAVGSSDATINDGSDDLNISDGIDLIKGIFQKARLIGNTDSNLIGNVGDSLKVTTTNDSNNPIPISFENKILDSFGRVRVSLPESLFDSTFTTGKNPELWAELLATGGTAIHDANISSVVLTTTTASGSSAIYQTRRYFSYHAGKSQLILLSGNLNGSKTNCRKRYGHFDADNGTFFELNDSVLSVVVRSNTSGSPVDTVINQSAWNIDKLDGTGISGITIDTSKQQIFIVDYQWLGSGSIRFGFIVDGSIVYCHQQNNGNSLTVPWSNGSYLPIRGEIVNTGTTASVTDLNLTCCTVTSEGDFAPEGLVRTINSSATPKSFSLNGTTQPILSLRKQSAFVKVPIDIAELGIFVDSSDDFLITIVLNGTLTGASWTNVAGIGQKDISATAINGGQELGSFYVRGSSQSASISNYLSKSLNSSLGVGLDGVSDNISIVGTNLTTSASAFGFINYKELI